MIKIHVPQHMIKGMLAGAFDSEEQLEKWSMKIRQDLMFMDFDEQTQLEKLKSLLTEFQIYFKEEKRENDILVDCDGITFQFNKYGEFTRRYH